MGQMDIIGSGALLAKASPFVATATKPGGKMWTEFHLVVKISVNHFCLMFK